MSTLLFKDLPITPQEKFDEAIKHGVKAEYGEDGRSVVGHWYKGVFYVCDVRAVKDSGLGAALIEAEEFLNDLFEEEINLDRVK